MSNTGLIDDSREEGQKYHYFTFKEIIYLLLVKELKRFSFEIDQLLDLKDTFFKKVPKNDVNDKSNKNNSEIAISLVLMHVQIFLVIDSNFKAYFIDLSNLSDIINQNYSLHCLDFNELINKHLESLNIEMVEPEIKTLDNLYFEVAKQSKKT